MFGKDAHALASAFRRLTADLYHRLAAGAGNIFYSPFSVATALMLIHAGARGDTRREIEQAIGIDLPDERLHRALSKLNAELAERDGRNRHRAHPLDDIDANGELPADDAGPADFYHRFVSSVGLWRQNSYACEAGYLRVAAEVFGAEDQKVDFSGRPEEAAATINRWVQERTWGLIDQIISPASIPPLTRLVLASATYFKAAWLKKFEKALTDTAKFHLLDGPAIDIEMMESTTQLTYARHEDFQTVGLPYASSFVRFVIVLPDSGRFEAVEKSLDVARLDAILFDRVAQAEGRVRLRLPRFRMEASVDLRPSLEEIGIQALFGERADLSGMSPESGFHVDRILHNSYVSIDEEGTEAAAATIPLMLGATLVEPQYPIEVSVDRPFLFFIIDRLARTILFCGRLVQPDKA